MRHWLAHRQAYTPRLWPVLVVASPVLAAINMLALHRLGLLVMVAVDVGLGLALAQTRWWIWRRRHPALSPDEYLNVRRQSARWN